MSKESFRDEFPLLLLHGEFMITVVGGLIYDT